MMRSGFILALFALAVLPISQAFSQGFTDSNTTPALGDHYTLPESYYNSVGQSASAPAPVASTAASDILDSTEQPLAETKEEQETIHGVLSHLEMLRMEFDELKKGLAKPEDIAGYDGGFFLKSRDGNFLLKINGRAQGKYAFNIAEDLENKHSFLIRRAYLFFSGNAYSPKLNYMFLMALNATESSDFLAGFDINYKFYNAFTLHFWRDNLPITSGYLLSSGKLQFVSKSIADARYHFGDGVALVADGIIGKKLKYSAGIFNGIGQGLKVNANNEMTYAARVQCDLLNSIPFMGGGDQAYTEKPSLAIDAGGGFGHIEDGTQARIMLGTTGLDFKYRGYDLKLAGYFRFTDPDQFTQAQNDTGFTVETGYFFIPKRLELALRASALIDDLTDAGINLNMKGSGESSLGGAHAGNDVGGDADNEWEYSAGLNYYFGPNGYNTKIQVQYSLIHDGRAGPDDLTNHIGQTMVTVGF